MARISDPKTGKLTKKYRDPSVFNSTRRGRKPDLLKILLSPEPATKKRKQARKPAAAKAAKKNKNLELSKEEFRKGCAILIVALLLFVLLFLVLYWGISSLEEARELAAAAS